MLRSLLRPLKTRVKLRLAGDAVEPLIANRARGRLRWLAFDSPDPVLRFRALRNLAEMMDPDSTARYLQIIGAEPGSLDPTVVRTAAEALGRMMNGDAAEALVRLLARNRPAGVQIAAARALATIGRDGDWQAVRDWAQRVDGAEQLFPDERDCVEPPKREPLGTTTIVWVLEALYADKGARWWASKASKWLASGQPSPRMRQDAGADKIVAASHRNALDRKDLDDEEFRRVVLHLGSLARDRDQERLVALVDEQQDLDRRRLAIQALGLQGDPRSVALFEGWLAECPAELPELAADLARAAGRLGFQALAAPVSRLFAYDDPAVRLNVLWALGECGGEEAVRFLVDLVRDRERALSDDEFAWIAAALLRCGVIGREGIRGSVAIAKAGGGERDRVKRVADLAGIH